MPTFLMLMIGRPAQPDADDRQTKDDNQQWAAYMKELFRARAVESAAPLEARGKVVAANSVSDLKTGEIDIGGYAVVEADSLAAAVEIARRAPHIAIGGHTIVRPCIAMGADCARRGRSARERQPGRRNVATGFAALGITDAPEGFDRDPAHRILMAVDRLATEE